MGTKLLREKSLRDNAYYYRGSPPSTALRTGFKMSPASTTGLNESSAPSKYTGHRAPPLKIGSARRWIADKELA
jgi:hypothetical protein